MTDLIFLDDVEVELIDLMGNDDAIIDAARVSTKKSLTSGAADERNDRVTKRLGDYSSYSFEESLEHVAGILQEETEKDKGLINMLMRDRHGSPFEHCVLKVYVKAPIFVFREWHRHRIASYNEMSGRYTKLLPEFYVPRDGRPMQQIGKPGSYRVEPGTEDQVYLTAETLKNNALDAWIRYEHLLSAGIAKEVARMVLPFNIYSQMYCTINLRSLMNFLSLRTKTKENSKVASFPQDEISLGADKLEVIFAQHFPWTYQAFQDNGRVAP